MHQPKPVCPASRAFASLHLVFIGSVLCVLGCSLRSGIRPVQDDVACGRRLERLWNLIAAYRTNNGKWPKDFTVDGVHTHSWRVLVAPYTVLNTDAGTVYSSIGYFFDEPWDTQRNTKAIHRLPLWGKLVCISESAYSDYPYTSYLILKRPANDDEGWIDSLPSNAVIVVESAYCGVRWAEPRDLLWDELWEDGSPFGKGKLNSLHPRVVKALRVDGKVIDIPKDINEEDLKRLLEGSQEER